MNISSDRFGAKTIVLVVAGLVILATMVLIYKVFWSQVHSSEYAAICVERGPGTHAVSSDKLNKSQVNTVVICSADGSWQVLSRP